MPTPVLAKRKSCYVGDDKIIAAAPDITMMINVHTGGATIPIILPPEKSTQTWAALCQDVVQNSIMEADPKAIFKILTKISPRERLTHYVLRYGGGHSSIIRVDWYDHPTCPSLHQCKCCAKTKDKSSAFSTASKGTQQNYLHGCRFVHLSNIH